MGITVIVIIIFIIFGITFYLNSKKSLNIKIEELCEVKSDASLTGGWWFVVTDSNDSLLKKYDINFPEVDFNSYNLLISNGREIKEISYIKNRFFPFTKTHFADVLFSKELYPHTWFIYRIDKIDIYHDERSGEVRIDE